MSVLLIGVTHRDLPLEVFERFAVTADDTPKLLATLCARDHVSEAVVLATCNRTEIYVKAERFHGAFEDLRDLLVELSDVAPDRFLPHLTVLWDDEAIEHLFSVAAGLDSAVLGEVEVQGQVRSAQRLAADEGTLGPTLELAFRHALGAGKRVRTETSIATHTASVAQAAVEIARDRLGGDGALDGATVAVVGAGKMATSMARSLAQAGSRVVVANRNAHRGARLADEVGGTAVALAELPSRLADAQAVLCGTASSSTVLGPDQLAGASDLVVVDIAMPRDVDPAVGELAGVDLFDMDDVARRTEAGLDRRRNEVAAARLIVEDEVLRYQNATTARAAGPIIASMRTRAEQLRLLELERHASRIEALDPDTQALVDQVTKATLAKLLHEPSVRLREQAGTLRGDRLADALRDLFDLP
ncbi:MAG: glutamyl-tRNA reductase [Microthrixaceae bacterium]